VWVFEKIKQIKMLWQMLKLFNNCVRECDPKGRTNFYVDFSELNKKTIS
jgi:hypothetical protein